MAHPFVFDRSNMSIVTPYQSVPTMKIGDDVWFCAKPCALVLGYKDPKKAIKTNVDEDWQMPLSQLLVQDRNRGVFSAPPVPRTPNELAAKWIMWSGLLELCSESKMPLAKQFKKWVYGEVLPTILKTGSYSIYRERAAAEASEGELWNQQRLDGIHCFKLKNASVKKLIACCAGGSQLQELYKVISGAINRAILDYNGTKDGFLKCNQLPEHASIPELLDFDGQLLRSTMERVYHTHILDNWKELQAMTSEELKSRFNDLGKKMQEGNRLGGYTVPKHKLFTEEQLAARRKGLAIAKKQGLTISSKLLALSQPAAKKQKLLSAFVRK